MAGESVLYITGKRKWNGMEPTEVLFGWLVAFDTEWENEPFMRVDYNPLKKELGLAVRKEFLFSQRADGSARAAASRFRADAKAAAQREADGVGQEAAAAASIRKALLEAIVGGQALAILPHPGGLTQAWFAMSQLTERESLPYAPDKTNQLADHVRAMLESFVQKNAEGWNKVDERARALSA